MTLLELTPSDLFRVLSQLTTPEMARRASASLDTVLKDRGHGGVEELRRPLHISRDALYGYRKGRTAVDPYLIYKVAVIYTQDELPATPEELDALLDSGDLTLADQLFPVFYSDNHRDALTWLCAHCTDRFRCSHHWCDAQVA